MRVLPCSFQELPLPVTVAEALLLSISLLVVGCDAFGIDVVGNQEVRVNLFLALAGVVAGAFLTCIGFLAQKLLAWRRLRREWQTLRLVHQKDIEEVARSYKVPEEYLWLKLHEWLSISQDRREFTVIIALGRFADIYIQYQDTISGRQNKTAAELLTEARNKLSDSRWQCLDNWFWSIKRRLGDVRDEAKSYAWYAELLEREADEASALLAVAGYARAARLVDGIDAPSQRRYQLGQANVLVAAAKKFRNKQYIEQSIELFRSVLQRLDRQAEADAWADVQGSLGNALRWLGEREYGTGSLEEAVLAYRAALLERQQQSDPGKWAMTQHNLGNALRLIGERTGDTTRLAAAAEAYRQALSARSGCKRAVTCNRLGDTLLIWAEADKKPERMREALAQYRLGYQEWRLLNREEMALAVQRKIEYADRVADLLAARVGGGQS